MWGCGVQAEMMTFVSFLSEIIVIYVDSLPLFVSVYASYCSIIPPIYFLKYEE